MTVAELEYEDNEPCEIWVKSLIRRVVQTYIFCKPAAGRRMYKQYVRLSSCRKPMNIAMNNSGS